MPDSVRFTRAWLGEIMDVIADRNLSENELNATLYNLMWRMAAIENVLFANGLIKEIEGERLNIEEKRDSKVPQFEDRPATEGYQNPQSRVG
jgi:hypothetical protein